MQLEKLATVLCASGIVSVIIYLFVPRPTDALFFVLGAILVSSGMIVLHLNWIKQSN